MEQGMNKQEEKELQKSIEQNEWKRVENFSAVKNDLIRCVNSTKKTIFSSIKDMPYAH